jgi:secondary thiamine-phosphate synthase enzyme
MPAFYRRLQLQSDRPITILNLTPQIQAVVAESKILQGQVVVCSRHTTTAITVNENEERLLDDLGQYLHKLAPVGDRYLHNDLHLRDVPPDEPENAHSHLMAITLGNSETIPVVDGQLDLGTWQSVLWVDLDGPRSRTVAVQVWGEIS